MIRWTAEAQARLVSLLAEGKTARAIAEEMGGTRGAIKARMNDTGLHSLSFMRRPSHDDALRQRWATIIPELKRQLREEIEANA